MNPFTKAAAMALVVSNDMWYMHLYAKDEDFDKSHRLTQSYFDDLYFDADRLMEFAIQEGFDVVNPNKASELFPDYVIENGNSYSYFDVVTKSKEKLTLYVSSLRELREFTNKTDIQSRLDSIIESWDKEINYKLTRRTNVPTILNGFINSGLDNAIAYTIGR